MKVLLADDDRDLVEVTAYALRQEGFSIIIARDGDQALRYWYQDTPDVVLLDIKMPRLNGLEVCRRIRQTAATPVIMLTAAADEEDILQGFQSGADDYVTKPFSPRQLILRIQAVLRRSTQAPPPGAGGVLVVGDLALEIEAHRVQRGDQSIQLTPLQFKLFHLLAVNAGRVVSDERLAEYAWGYPGAEPGRLATHLGQLRRKLGFRHGQPPDIVAAEGGHRLALSQDEVDAASTDSEGLP